MSVGSTKVSVGVHQLQHRVRTERRRGPQVLLVALMMAALSVLAPSARGQQLLEDFLRAVANDWTSDLKVLLARGVDPNSVDRNGDPALVIAARAGNTAALEVLLAARANVNARNAFGDSALMLAAISGNLEIVRKLRLRGAEINHRGWTPLIYAATGGHDPIVRYLLAEGSQVDAASPNGTTALMMAARERRHSTLELLIAHGAEINHRNDDGASALDWAERGKDPLMAEQLRRAGAR